MADFESTHFVKFEDNVVINGRTPRFPPIVSITWLNGTRCFKWICGVFDLRMIMTQYMVCVCKMYLCHCDIRDAGLENIKDKFVSLGLVGEGMVSSYDSCYFITSCHGPLARYVKMRVAHAPGMPGTCITARA